METARVHSDFLDSIERLNRMLFIFSGSGAGPEEKPMGPADTERIEGLGDMVDCYR